MAITWHKTRIKGVKELLYANKAACTHPLPASELRTIMNSVTKYKR